MNTKPLIYADNAATTAVLPQALAAMLPLYGEHYANPSSVHSLGRKAKVLLSTARRQTAACLGAKPTEIYFTGSGTESDNWALKSASALMKQ